MSMLTVSGIHEWLSHDAFGRIKAADASTKSLPSIEGHDNAVDLASPGNGYVSFRLLIRGTGSYRLSVTDAVPLEVDLFKAWYHGITTEDGETTFLPDALIPVPWDTEHVIPDPVNGIAGQTAQEFWVDVYVPTDTAPGTVEFSIALISSGGEATLPVRIRRIAKRYPDRPTLLMDHNSYGSTWLNRLYGTKSTDTGATISLLHDYYRMVREHRGVFHNLGTSHSGSVSPLYAPSVQGKSRGLELTDWDTFDRHLGPLFSGEVFESAGAGQPRPRASAHPLETAYTPFTSCWPASYVKWGEKGYEVEFVRGLRAFDRHLVERGWTNTRLELYFNHKKRYRWFSWDGDQVKYPEDFRVHEEFFRLFDTAVASSEIDWKYRWDASWQIPNLYRRFGGRRNFWVCGGMHRWYPEEVNEVVDRGEAIWWYGGLPGIDAADTAILGSVYQTWARRLEGHCFWLTVAPDQDPWGTCQGNRTAAMYPGERFGIHGPIPSIRLKIQRNGVQDVDLLSADNQLRARFAEQLPVEVWQKKPFAAQIMSPEHWDSAILDYEHEPVHESEGRKDPFWWSEVRNTAHGAEA